MHLNGSVCAMPAHSLLVAALSPRLSTLQLLQTSHALDTTHKDRSTVRDGPARDLLGFGTWSVAGNFGRSVGITCLLTLHKLAPQHSRHGLRCLHQEAETCLHRGVAV